MSKDNNSEKQLEVGQVIYILSNENVTILPAMVIEEVIKRTINGDTRSWKVAIGPPNNKRKQLRSDEIDGEIFTSLEEVEKILKERLNNFISKTLEKTETRSEQWFGNERTDSNKKSKQYQKKEKTQNNKIDPGTLLNEDEENSEEKEKEETNQIQNPEQLFQGQSTKVKLDQPPPPGSNSSQNGNSSSGADAQSKIRQMVTPEEDDIQYPDPS